MGAEPNLIWGTKAAERPYAMSGYGR